MKLQNATLQPQIKKNENMTNIGKDTEQWKCIHAGGNLNRHNYIS
jgi:hypothetical protein